MRLLTNAERFALKSNPNFQAQLRMAIYAKGKYWRDHTGAALDAAGAENWFRNRTTANGVVFNPNSIDFNTWLEQAIIFLKDMQVAPDSNYTEDEVITYMIANSKFDEVTDYVFTLRGKKVEF